MRNSKKKKKRLQKKESRRTPKMTPHCSCENKGKLFKNHAGSARKQFHVNLLGPEQSTPPKIASMLLLLLPFSLPFPPALARNQSTPVEEQSPPIKALLGKTTTVRVCYSQKRSRLLPKNIKIIVQRTSSLLFLQKFFHLRSPLLRLFLPNCFNRIKNSQ